MSDLRPLQPCSHHMSYQLAKSRKIQRQSKQKKREEKGAIEQSASSRELVKSLDSLSTYLKTQRSKSHIITQKDGKHRVPDLESLGGGLKNEEQFSSRSGRSACSSDSSVQSLVMHPLVNSNPYYHMTIREASNRTARGSARIETSAQNATRPWGGGDEKWVDLWNDEWTDTFRQPCRSTEITQYTEAVIRQGLQPFALK